MNCSKGAISYHCGKGQKQKTLNRVRKRRKIQHPLSRKLESFLYRKEYLKSKKKPLYQLHKILYLKLNVFFRNRKTKMNTNVNITVDQVIEKIGNSPKCYLTGKEIDINQPRTYALDHIIPATRGGPNTLENMGICTKLANMSKTDMTLEEYIQLCKSVLENFGYKVEK